MTDLLSKEAVADIYTAAVHVEAQQIEDDREGAAFELECLFERHGGGYAVMRRIIDMMRTNERELAQRREAAENPVLYCMETAGNLDTESVSESKSVVDSWVDEWNSSPKSAGEPTYTTVPLFTAPPLPVVPDVGLEQIANRYSLTIEQAEIFIIGYDACRAAMLQSGRGY